MYFFVRSLYARAPRYHNWPCWAHTARVLMEAGFGENFSSYAWNFFSGLIGRPPFLCTIIFSHTQNWFQIHLPSWIQYLSSINHYRLHLATDSCNNETEEHPKSTLFQEILQVAEKGHSSTTSSCWFRFSEFLSTYKVTHHTPFISSGKKLPSEIHVSQSMEGRDNMMVVVLHGCKFR